MSLVQPQSTWMQSKMRTRSLKKSHDGSAVCKTCTRHVHLQQLSTRRICLILKLWCKSGTQRWRQLSNRLRSQVQKLTCEFKIMHNWYVRCVTSPCISHRRIIPWLSLSTSSSLCLVNSVRISISNSKSMIPILELQVGKSMAKKTLHRSEDVRRNRLHENETCLIISEENMCVCKRYESDTLSRICLFTSVCILFEKHCMHAHSINL